MQSPLQQTSPPPAERGVVRRLTEARMRGGLLSRSLRQRSRRGSSRAAPAASHEVVDVKGLSVELFAHDLRSPLLASRRAVTQLIDQARAPNGGPAEFDEDVLLALERSLERMDHLMVDILELASLPVAEMPMQVCPAMDLVTTVRNQCSDRDRVHYVVQLLLGVYGNPTLLHRALLNLIENALHYTVGPVEVELSRVADGVMMFVDDHGPGVPAELRDVIFEPLTRADPEASVGSGLGLTLVRRVAEAHGGLAGVEAAPSGGARFVLWVPHAVRLDG